MVSTATLTTVIVINQPLFTGGKLFSRFADKDGNAVEMHEWSQEGVAGLGAYLYSDRFVGKIFKHIAENGADMVDAWLIDKMCSRNAVVGLCTLNPVDPQLESAWFLPLSLIKRSPGFKLCFRIQLVTLRRGQTREVCGFR